MLGWIVSRLRFLSKNKKVHDSQYSRVERMLRMEIYID